MGLRIGRVGIAQEHKDIRPTGAGTLGVGEVKVGAGLRSDVRGVARPVLGEEPPGDRPETIQPVGAGQDRLPCGRIGPLLLVGADAQRERLAHQDTLADANIGGREPSLSSAPDTKPTALKQAALVPAQPCAQEVVFVIDSVL